MHNSSCQIFPGKTSYVYAACKQTRHTPGEQHTRGISSWHNIYTVQGAREPVAAQMQVEMAAEQQYKNFEPLYFGTSSDGITLRHLLPDIYEV